MYKLNILASVMIIGISAFYTSAQIASGGGYVLEQTAIANGGGISADNGYVVKGTLGQTISNQSSGNGFSLRSGFWQASLAPTAAAVSISGKVLTLYGTGLPNAVVFLTDEFGGVRTARTNSFGNFRFENIEAGQTVVVAVQAKQFEFLPTALSVNDDISNLIFVPIGQL